MNYQPPPPHYQFNDPNSLDQPYYGPPKDPGRTLGIVGMILAIAGLPIGFVFYIFGVGSSLTGSASTFFILAFVEFAIGAAGLVLSILGKVKSSSIGRGNGMALTGIIMSPFSIMLAVWMFFIAYSVRNITSILNNEDFYRDAYEESEEFEDLMDELDNMYIWNQ